MDVTTFETIASSLTVRLICSPLGPDLVLAPDTGGVTEIDERILSSITPDHHIGASDRPLRVIDSNGNVFGIARLNDLYNAEFSVFNEALERLEPDDFLSADTNILEAISLFSSRRSDVYFYILQKNDVIGILYYSDIFKPLGRLAFLALALEIEHLTLDLCGMFHVVKLCWEALSDNRKKKALAFYEKRYGPPAERIDGKDPPLAELIECTYLSDKANMIWKNRLIPVSSRKSVLGFFKKLEEIRDFCAHPRLNLDLAEKLPPKILAGFINEAKEMKKTLLEAIEENRVKQTEIIEAAYRKLALSAEE